MPTKPTTDLPKVMLDELEPGYYATRPDSNESWTFLRISRPNRGKLSGCLKVQSMHSDQLMNRWIQYPSGNVWYDHLYHGGKIEQYVLLIMCDMIGCTMRYAEINERCGRCNKKLTDERSRWYGIGPECELIFPWWISTVNDGEKGPYILGVSDRDA